MMDWTPYLNTGRCCADAFEREFRRLSAEAARTAKPEVMQLPAGKLTVRRDLVLRPVPGGHVTLYGPATWVEYQHLAGRVPPSEKQRTASGEWGFVMPEPKIVGN